MDSARIVLDRLDRIDALKREAAPPGVLLEEVRSLLVEAEEWVRTEAPADGRAAAALARCREAVEAGGRAADRMLAAR